MRVLTFAWYALIGAKGWFVPFGLMAVLVGALALSGCASTNQDGPDRGDLYLAVALETAVGTLVSLEAVGTLPPEGGAFIDATLGYGDEACRILQDPTLTVDQKRLALLTELADERAAFDASFRALAGASSIDREVLLVVLPAVNGARAAVRIALTEQIDPAGYGRVCASVQQLQASWDLQRPEV